MLYRALDSHPLMAFADEARETMESTVEVAWEALSGDSRVDAAQALAILRELGRTLDEEILAWAAPLH